MKAVKDEPAYSKRKTRKIINAYIEAKQAISVGQKLAMKLKTQHIYVVTPTFCYIIF